MPDARAVIPLHAISAAPWNPKKPIAGRYRAGLAGSLDHFGVRDDLKVWPDPARPGHYYALDGNQRLDVLREKGVESVECRILADLDPEDAKLFTAAFNRNHAKYDEGALAGLADQLEAKGRDLIDALLRPERPAVPLPDEVPDAPPPMPMSAATGPDGTPAEAPAPTPAPARIPVMFSLSRDGYEEVMGGILRTRARLLREDRLREALAALSDREVDSVVVELALRCCMGG